MRTIQCPKCGEIVRDKEQFSYQELINILTECDKRHGGVADAWALADAIYKAMEGKQ